MRYNNIEKVLSADMTMMTFIDSVGNLLTSLGNQIPPQMLYAFAISCIVLFISTIIKYGLGVSLDDMKKMQMLLELSIDVCAVIATIIASMETSKPYSLVLFMSFSSIIPILIGSIARRYWLTYSMKGLCWQSALSSIINIAMPIVWLIIICEIFFFNN